MQLGLEEGRVIGCLIEKQLTTPQQYPLTLNALVSACNQSSNRDPVVCYDDRSVQRALARLKDAGLVRFVYPSHGRSVTRYQQVFEERLGLDERSLALVAVLLLRGPQTAGELRGRTERMATFEAIGAVELELERLSEREDPLASRLLRRPGQKEERWVQLLTPAELEQVGAIDDRGGEAGTAGAPWPSADGAVVVRPATGSEDPGSPVGHSDSAEDAGEQLTTLAGEVASLRAEVAALRAAVEQLRSEPLRQLGEGP
ncbi:MAG TPA: DUF480 domain-containing protein [Acidimicrobiales bacterium]|nr:DUF480 domain-containing protein [Acidimicrobiales bacterium]